jgi:hypothetical protein
MASRSDKAGRADGWETTVGNFLTQPCAKRVIFGAGSSLDLLFHALALFLYFDFTSRNDYCYFVTFAPALLVMSLLFSLVPLLYFGVIHSEDEKRKAMAGQAMAGQAITEKEALVATAKTVQKDQCFGPLRYLTGQFSATLKSLAIFTMSLPYLFVPLVLGAYSAIRDSIREDQPYNASIWGAPKDVLKDTEPLNSLNTMILYLWVIIGSKLFVLFYGHFGYLYRTR